MCQRKQDLQMRCHHTSCKSSRKFFVLSWESTLQDTTGLNVNFTAFYVKLIDLSYFKLNRFGEIFVKHTQLLLVTRSAL